MSYSLSRSIVSQYAEWLLAESCTDYTVLDGQKFGWGYQLLLTLTCQMLGLGLAGLTRKWLVEPAAMLWPSNLVSLPIYSTIVLIANKRHRSLQPCVS